MGKWAQQKKRGSSVGIHLPPPPQPFMEDIAGDLIQHALGEDDPGGLLRLYEGPTEFGPWALLSTLAWSRLANWGAISSFDGPYLVGAEVGNGVTYEAESQPSDAFAV